MRARTVGGARSRVVRRWGLEIIGALLAFSCAASTVVFQVGVASAYEYDGPVHAYYAAAHSVQLHAREAAPIA